MDKLPNGIQTCLIMAARYAHKRNTGAAFAVTTAISDAWEQLHDHIQQQIIEESHEAWYCLDDWGRFRERHGVKESES